MVLLVAASRRRFRLFIVLAGVLALLAVLWTAGWYVAAGKVGEVVAAWKEREARSGRAYNCSSESIGGFPFGIHVRCAKPVAILTEFAPPMSLSADRLLVAARLWQPSVLTATVGGPLTVEAPGHGESITGRWANAIVTVHGLPQEPRRLDVDIVEPVVVQGAGDRLLFEARRLEIDGTMVEGSARASPVVQVAVRAAGAKAPAVHSATAPPADVDLVAVLRGMKDFAPKPWTDRLRELQAGGGHIEITSARIEQGGSLAVARGKLGLSANGRLEGQLELTIAGLENLLASLGLDDALAKGEQMNAAIGALDRLAPGLGRIARNNAGSALAVGLAFIGRPTKLDDRNAVAVPLRFTDGVVALGPLRLGETPPLY